MPTIAFKDIRAYSEFMDDGKSGLLVERDVGALADAVEELAKDSSLYRSVSIQGIAAGRKFSWDNVMRTFYEEMKKRIFSL